ncbi:glucose 1-dehydrogenase [Bradyrhizobium sp. BR 10289]|uniref:SDR family NAD(P)-dependent oxidoreductase n=1 Tax=Bradyrhizobium sp. BR 10289 TaxID=2749993 RepID=UPI001C652819|nr:glucose 1-dehydrogenase [Bradyrhizobium sp. BR 10289]MBW7969366.1 glucose 1-dehydrogenase [Bradyrhizobium sp. BR 10289]
MNKLQNRVALVTGGSTGIGLASAKLFAEEGAKVFITGRRQAELDAAVKTIAHGAVAVRCDISRLSDLDALYSRIQREAGHLDVVFANAGIAEFRPLSAVTEDHYDSIFDINVKGTLFTVQKALPLLRDGGSIILTSSGAGYKGLENFSVYSATKAAIRSFARTFLMDLKARKIRVNVVSPGPTETPGLTGLVPADHKDGFLGHLSGTVPLGRVGSPREVAQAALFLASDEASFVNGVELNVDGGANQI